MAFRNDTGQSGSGARVGANKIGERVVERGIERGDSDRDNGGRYMNNGLAQSINVGDRP